MSVPVELLAGGADVLSALSEAADEISRRMPGARCSVGSAPIKGAGRTAVLHVVLPRSGAEVVLLGARGRGYLLVHEEARLDAEPIPGAEALAFALDALDAERERGEKEELSRTRDGFLGLRDILSVLRSACPWMDENGLRRLGGLPPRERAAWRAKARRALSRGRPIPSPFKG